MSSSSRRRPDLAVTVAGSIRLHTCLYNASGPRSGTAAALQRIHQSRSGAVLTKSATLVAQSGNPQPRTYHLPSGWASFNSEGLPNSGIDYYIDPATINEATTAVVSGRGGDSCTTDASTAGTGGNTKPYIVSLSGKTLQDNVEMLQRIASAPTLSRIAGLELNLACPNIVGHPIIGYDIPQMDTTLHQIGQVLSQTGNVLPPLGVKLPPYLDVTHMEQAAACLNRHKSTVKYVVSINTVGNALVVDGAVTEAPVLASNSGYAGLSGSAIKYTALANVRKLRELLSSDMDVVGVGGIASGQDVFDMLLAGATAVQTATAHWIEGPDCFDRILTELSDILRHKGYASVHEVTGKLRPWSKEGAALLRAENSKNKSSSTKDPMGSKKKTNDVMGSDLEQQLSMYKMVTAVLAVVVAALLSTLLTGSGGGNILKTWLLPTEQ
jgi:dihydroorotate dehydrogenase (fumarate)